MSRKIIDTSFSNISKAVEHLYKKANRQGSNQYLPESEESTEDLVKQHEKRGHINDNFGLKALGRSDVTKDHLNRLFHAGNTYRQVIHHPKVDKEMMKGYLDHAHKNFKNDLALKAVAHKGKEMGLKHPLIDKMDKGELKPTTLDSGSGPDKDYRGPSGSWTGD